LRKKTLSLANGSGAVSPDAAPLWQRARRPSRSCLLSSILVKPGDEDRALFEQSQCCAIRLHLEAGK